MRKAIVLLIALAFVASGGDLWAQEGKKWEFSLSAAGVSASSEVLRVIPGGVFSCTYYPTKVIGVEFGTLVVISDSAFALLTGGVIVSLPNLQRVIPYVAGGVWTTTFGGIGWNIGGGLKIRATETLALRFEYRRWALFEELEYGANFFSGGISIFF